MQKITTGKLSMTYAGCFLGAGYVSGQELWQFFGVCGIKGFWGLLLTTALLALFGLLLFRYVHLSGCSQMDTVIIPWNVPWLRNLFGLLQSVFLFGVTVIMCAGAGALISQRTALPAIVGIIPFLLLLLLLAHRGVTGFVNTFSVLVPLLVLGAVVISAAAVIRFGLPAFPAGAKSSNPLLSGWVISAVVYASYNLFGSIGVLTPVAVTLGGCRAVRPGILLGSGALLLISGSILAALGAAPDVSTYPLPMLELADRLHPAAGWVYAVLLLFGMFGTALSSCVALLTYLYQKFPPLDHHRPQTILSTGCFLLLGSLAGFGTLIGVIYPCFGYIGMVSLLLLLFHTFRLRFLSGHGKR